MGGLVIAWCSIDPRDTSCAPETDCCLFRRCSICDAEGDCEYMGGGDVCCGRGEGVDDELY